MCRFLPGSESPPPKKVKSKEDVSESTKNYEKNKRQRAFQNSWKQERTWLVFNDDAMFYSVFMTKRRQLWMPVQCVSHKNSFTSGNYQCKLETQSCMRNRITTNRKKLLYICSCKDLSMWNTSHEILLVNAPLIAMEQLFKFFILNKRKTRATSFWDHWATKNSRKLARLATKHWN